MVVFECELLFVLIDDIISFTEAEQFIIWNKITNPDISDFIQNPCISDMSFSLAQAVWSRSRLASRLIQLYTVEAFHDRAFQ